MEVKALRASMDPEGKFNSPLAQGRVDEAYDNLKIRLLHYPKIEDFVKTASFGEAAHAGGALDPIAELDSLGPNELTSKVKQFMHGGLEQFLESDTVVYLVYGCTRGYTHEIVRTRNGAWFFQQTSRHSYLGDANLRMPEYIANSTEEVKELWVRTTREAINSYINMCENHDVPYQDARTVIPVGMQTWIVIGMPLRTYLNMNSYRTCAMFYPEMVWIQRKVGDLVKEACPWLSDKIKIGCESSKVCEYRGVEETHDSCDKPWAHIRRWKSDHYAAEGKDVLLKDHNKKGCKICKKQQ